MKKYDHKKIESKWRKTWEKSGIYKTEDFSKRSKYYILDMFPYPSGSGLHVGHPRGYVATDILSRFKRMNNFNVLHPMGWDAFGLPAENNAIKNKVNPRISTKENIKRYKEQLTVIGIDYDWEREINTTDVKYYKWTQWIFLQLLKKGLAYESYEPINWCPSCKTGLANEDLDGDKCERCDSVVLQKPMRQWVLKITDYAERLLADLDGLNWPESIKESQRNWIGKSEGADIDFKVKDVNESIKVFTTRVDTIFGATYLVLAPEHNLVMELKERIENWKEVSLYLEEVKSKTEIERTDAGKEKTGVELKGVTAVNPASGEDLPVFIADYVLAHYGTGAIMAVPAHDTRDFQFAIKFKLPIKEVTIPNRIDKRNPPIEGKEKVVRQNVHAVICDKKANKFLCLKWKKHDWTTFPMGGVEEGEDVIDAARREVLEETGYKNLKKGKVLGGQVRAEYFAAHKDVNRVSFSNLVLFELADDEKEAVSQEEADEHDIFWADPKEITTESMTHAEMDIWLERMSKKDHTFRGEGVLINSGKFDGVESSEAKKVITREVKGKNVTTYKLRDWVFSRQRYWGEPIPVIHCEKCGVVPVNEKDLPVKLPDVKSYEPTGTGESPLAGIDSWVNTKCPKCGGKGKRETNTMPQWAGSSWYYLRYIDPSNDKKLIDSKKEKYWMGKNGVDMYVGGTEHATRHLIYSRFWHKFLLDIGTVSTKEPFGNLKNQGLIMAEDGRKMSKRWGNIVNPDEVIGLYGADTFRMYEMFIGPFEQSVVWSTESMIGSRRFLEKVWRLKEKVSLEHNPPSGILNPTLEKSLHQTIKKVTEDIEDFHFNTAISQMMIFLNETEHEKGITLRQYKSFLCLLAPFAPHITEELWSELEEEKSIHLTDWPSFDESKILDESFTLVIQVNGKVIDQFEAKMNISEEKAKELTLNRENVKNSIQGKKIKKLIFIKNKLLNIVI